jgi:hypothetical protein
LRSVYNPRTIDRLWSAYKKQEKLRKLHGIDDTYSTSKFIETVLASDKRLAATTLCKLSGIMPIEHLLELERNGKLDEALKLVAE